RAERALVSVAKDTLDNQDRHLKQIQGFVELGARPAIDLAQSRTEVANAKVSVITAENAYATAKAQLNQAMGIAAPLDYEVAPDTLAPVEGEDQPTDALVQIALTSRPELVAAKKQIQAQEQLLRSARGNYAPTLSASTGVTDAGRSLDNLTWNWNAGVQITWPLFQGLAVPAQVREAEANIAVAKAQRDGEEQQLRLEVEQARLAVRAAKASILAVEEAVQNARERLRLAEGRYQTGVGNAIELGDAQNAKSTSEGERVRADYDLATARAQLLRALGRD
ncbi:MAG TPA: TolC family protein, partial [Polyangiaceae bacterium]|nr:TolC family protein [Polyangiaceae bacterium]